MQPLQPLHPFTPAMLLTDLPSDLLAHIAAGLPTADRKSLSHASPGLHAASLLASWWPPQLRVIIPDPEALASFATWLEARSLGATTLSLCVDSEQLIEDANGACVELPRSATYDHGAAFLRLLSTVVDHVPYLQNLLIAVPDGTLFLPVG